MFHTFPMSKYTQHHMEKTFLYHGEDVEYVEIIPPHDGK